MLPATTFISKLNTNRRGFSELPELSSDVVALLTPVLVFRQSVVLSESFFDQLDEFRMILHAICYNNTFSGRNVIHYELLKQS